MPENAGFICGMDLIMILLAKNLKITFQIQCNPFIHGLGLIKSVSRLFFLLEMAFLGVFLASKCGFFGAGWASIFFVQRPH